MTEKARVWKFGQDVDTDQIIPSQYIILPGIEDMKAHAFEPLDADFAKKVRPGDVIVAGANFGSGSSREQAPAVLKALGLRAVIAHSVARIFFRNAVNVGLPVVLCPGFEDAVDTGDEIELDLAAGTLAAHGKGWQATRLPPHMQAILQAGGLLESLKGSGAPASRAQPAAENTAKPKIPMTMAEKLIALAAGRPAVQAGDIVTVALDGLMSNDGTTHLTVGMLEQLQKADPAIGISPPAAAPSGPPLSTLGGLRGASGSGCLPSASQPSAIAPETAAKTTFVIDHNCPADSPKTAQAHRIMRDFAKEHSIKLYEGAGVCHQLMAEEVVTPGQLLIGADSHTCTYGALGAFGTGVGATDLLYGLVTGTTWLMVPQTMRFTLTGALPPGATARDLMLTILGDIGADGATYKVMEFAGPGLAALSLSERLVLSNLAVEAGAKTALMAPDEVVLRYITQKGRRPKAVLASDEGAAFAAEYHYDLSKIVPVAARPHRVDDVVPVSQLGEVTIDEAFLGSCSNGRIEHLRAAAAVLKGRRVHPGVRFLISPASNAVLAQALGEGLIEIFNTAGALVVNPNCSVCWGSCQGVLGHGETLISTGTRNFRGRAGPADSFVYLASAQTVAASAVAGRITIPEAL